MAVKPTQEFVPIKEIRNGIVILKDGSMRAILMTSAVNLALKSYDEQQGTIYLFQNFLNSLDFSIQIVTQSRKLNIKPYISSLREREEEVPEPLLKLQIHEYANFIETFTDQINVMKKHFFVVIPFTPVALDTSGKGNILKDLFGKSKQTENMSPEKFSEGLSQLEQRVSLVQSGLSRVGVQSALLENEEEIELFYSMFNMGDGTTSIQNKVEDK